MHTYARMQCTLIHMHHHTLQILIMGPGGNLVYHGPVSDVENYFREQFGFVRPSTVGPTFPSLS
jgi:hypothetical protein